MHHIDTIEILEYIRKFLNELMININKKGNCLINQLKIVKLMEKTQKLKKKNRIKRTESSQASSSHLTSKFTTSLAWRRRNIHIRYARHVPRRQPVNVWIING